MTISTTWLVVFAALAVWDLVWRGMALWRASGHDQRAWFVILLVINSAGVLPIVYLLTNKEKSYE